MCKLYINNNRLTSINPEIVNLPALNLLDARGNSLEYTSESIPNNLIVLLTKPKILRTKTTQPAPEEIRFITLIWLGDLLKRLKFW